MVCLNNYPIIGLAFCATRDTRIPVTFKNLPTPKFIHSRISNSPNKVNSPALPLWIFSPPTIGSFYYSVVFPTLTFCPGRFACTSINLSLPEFISPLNRVSFRACPSWDTVLFKQSINSEVATVIKILRCFFEGMSRLVITNNLIWYFVYPGRFLSHIFILRKGGILSIFDTKFVCLSHTDIIAHFMQITNYIKMAVTTKEAIQAIKEANGFISHAANNLIVIKYLMVLNAMSS